MDGLAQAILSVLPNTELREKFYAENLRQLREKANHQAEMQKMETLYRQLISESGQVKAKG